MSMEIDGVVDWRRRFMSTVDGDVIGDSIRLTTIDMHHLPPH